MRNRDLILRIIVLALLLYSSAAFIMCLSDMAKAEEQLGYAENELAALREENEELKDELALIPDRNQMEILAREKLGMLMPGEKIFIFSTDREEPKWCRK